MKKNKNLLYAFIVPIFIMIFIMLLEGFYPFGNKTLLMLDGIKQYPGFLGLFIDNINHGKNLLYSFKGLLGFNLYAVIVYYLFNITNIFAFVFGKVNILNFYTFIIILKIALCSLSMCILLNYVNKNKNNNLLFSLCYGLMVYNTLYYINFMWFDSIILFPMVILGIEKIFKENKYIFYCIMLALTILSNFYIGYMICLFSVIYFIYKYILNKKKDKKIIIKYLLYSLLSGLIASIILIPVILELLNGKGTLISNYYKNYLKFDLDFISVFYKLTIGSFLNGDLEYGTPNVYVSIFVYVNTILYFFNKKIKLKEKINSGIIIIIFLLSMSFNFLDYFWQMMQLPIWYPVRYAFIFDLFLILLASKNFNSDNNLSVKQNIFAFILIFVLSSIGFITAGNLIDKINISAKLIYFGISLLFIVYYFIFINSKDLKKYCLILLIFELSLNTFLSLKNTGNANTIAEFNNDYYSSNQIISKINDKDFYRLSIVKKTTKNNGALLNYNDINYFSSIRNNKVVDMLENYFGFSTVDGCNVTYYYNNPVFNALFDIKYYVSNKKIDYYDLLKKDKNYYLYKNNDATSLGFVTNDLSNLSYHKDYVENINNLVKKINNDDKNILTKIKITDKNTVCDTNTCITTGEKAYIKYNFKINNKGFININNAKLLNDNKNKYEIKINNKVIGKSSDVPYLVNKNDKVEITINADNLYNDPKYYSVYFTDYNVYQNLITNINKNKLIISNYNNDNYIEGNVDVIKDNSLLFTTISNDNGWKVYVDGKLTKKVNILNGLIGVKLNKGKHKIEFKYRVPGLKLGITITSLSLLILIYLIIKRK